ncbi:MAG: HIT family protein [Planctomycetota bacterium]
MTHEPTIFDKIIAGEIPSHRVHEDDHTLAFLDVAPLSRGHTLVIPKERAAQMDQLSDEAAAALGRVLPRVCRAVLKATGAAAYNLLQNNGADAHQAVMHLHVHIIPRYPDKDEGTPGSGLGIGWPAGSLEDGEMLAAKIKAAIAG